jgi:hypothetical protein
VSIPEYPAAGYVVALKGLLVVPVNENGAVRLPDEPETCLVNVAVGVVAAGAAMVIEPAPLVMVIPDPAVMVVTTYPDPFPIGIAPFAGTVVTPVPPFAIGRVPEMSPTGITETVETAPAPPDPAVFTYPAENELRAISAESPASGIVVT